MCGIFGVIGDDKIEINKSLDSIRHRGPDDKGVYKDENITLGFRRLSIIDLSPLGHQPMTNEDKTIWLIFNGEIYNFKEIKKELIRKHKFISNTDSEVLIHGYEEWGIDILLNKINGMFAFCIYDKNRKTTYLARDRIGKKPLYYYKSRNYLAFSSEVKAFFEIKDFKFNFDEEMLHLWFGFPYLPDNNKTIIKHILKVPPSSYLKIEENKISIKKYWEIPSQLIFQNFNQAKKKLETLLIDSVKKRLIADVPVGILLSGGLDSSLITALASKYSQKKVKTINISFANSTIDESSYANIVAKHCHTDHENLVLNTQNIFNTFREKIDIYDDLSTTDSGLFSEYLLAKEIRKKGILVVLVGEGADEIFGGYSWFGLSKFPFSIFPNNMKDYLYYYAIMRRLPLDKFSFYKNYLSKKMSYENISYFKKIQRYEISYSLPNHYCMKVDKATSAASIEARAPFMDYRLVELASKIKDSYLLHGNIFNPKESNEKYILRSIAKKYLPDEIVYKKKKGGMLPVYDLLNIGIKNEKNNILKNKYLINFYGKEHLTNLIYSKPKFSVRKWYREWVLWKCLVFSLWFDHYTSYNNK